MTDRVAFHDRQPYVDSYDEAAHLLAHGGAPETRGRLLPHGGPLRRLVVGDQGVTNYWMTHEDGPDQREDFDLRNGIVEWNLDYTLRTVIGVGETDGSRRHVNLPEFVTELCVSLGEDPGEDSIEALSLGLRIENEKYWLGMQQDKLKERASAHAGKKPFDVDDEVFHSLAADVPLRSAFINQLRSKMVERIHTAHNIAKTDYDPLREAAWMTILGRGDSVGRPYMSTEHALEVLSFSGRPKPQGVTE